MNRHLALAVVFLLMGVIAVIGGLTEDRTRFVVLGAAALVFAAGRYLRYRDSIRPTGLPR